MRSILNPYSLIPTFWRYSKANEKYVLDAAEQSVNDLQKDITTRYSALKIETCDDYKPELMRPMYVYRLTDSSVWNTLKAYQKKFFKERYYIWPKEDKWQCNQEITDAETLYNGTYLVNGTDFFVHDGIVQFEADPFDIFAGQTEFAEIETPWKKTYEYERLVLWASDIKMTESVLDTHYADLVMDKDLQKIFRTTGAYQAFVYNFFKVLYQGATTAGLAGFVNSMSGIGYIQEDWETVVTFYFDVNPETGSICRVIVTDAHKYYIPVDVPIGPWVKLGAKLPKFTTLGEYIQVKTYLEDPDWVFKENNGSVDDIVIFTDGNPLPDDLDPDHPEHFKFSFLGPGSSGLTDAEKESYPDNLLPKFDICRQISDNTVQSFRTGLWHNIVGPNLVQIEYPYELENTSLIMALKNFILPEITPIHVHCHWQMRQPDGWFFYDPEYYPESTEDDGGAWFQDEIGNLIADPEYYLPGGH